MENGFVKLHRSLLDWEWFSDKNTTRLFIYLLLKANWKDGNFQGKTIPTGSLVTSLAHLSRDTGLSTRSIRTSLEHLKSTHEVTIKTTKKYTLITIEKWAFFQGDTNKNDKVNDKEQGTQTTTIEEYKNKNNIISKECEDVVSLYKSICTNLTPLKTLTPKRVSRTKKILKKYTLEQVMDVFRKASNDPYKQGNNPMKWKADYTWLMDEENFVKVLEGTDTGTGQDKKLEDLEFESIGSV